MTAHPLRMPRYFLDIHDANGCVEDRLGVELPDVASVRERAIKDARAIMASQIRSGTLDLTARIAMRIDGAREVAAVRFDEAVEISGKVG